MKSRRNIVNIVNFIRAVEPRLAMDLVLPVQRQIELVNRHRLPATWLLQYDALTQGPYVDLLKRGLGDDHEIGGWFEVVQPLVEKAGLPWRGRYAWDWHANVGFSIGYTPAEREKLADVFMADFKACFGRYPASIGSWFLDAHLLRYLHDRYGLAASCNCKDQWGTDGYTLWGGYWNHAYYPSRLNAFMPAQTAAAQIPVPTFRMLGSDPMDQYDAGRHAGQPGRAVQSQSVVTLEPVYREGGGNPAWVRWFFDLITTAPCLAFGYTQVGQENSFGWPAMESGLTDQLEWLAELRSKAVVQVETLADSGRWFRREYPVTPATAVTALRDFQDKNRQSVWYQSRFYRVNLFWQDGQCRVRDIHLFNEAYPERYLSLPCQSTACTYDTLPVAEGFLWSGAAVESGFVLLERTADGAGIPLQGGVPVVDEADPATLRVRWPLGDGRDLVIECAEAALAWRLSGDAWWLEQRWEAVVTPPFRQIVGDQILCCHAGFEYTIGCQPGTIELDLPAGSLRLRPGRGQVSLKFAIGRDGSTNLEV